MELTANAIQTVASNANILFTDTVVPGNCAILHRDDSGLVNLRGLTNQCRARFLVSFGGNVGLTAGDITPITVAIAINGEPVASTTMIQTPAALGNYYNVASSVFVDVPACSSYTISVTNTTAIPISVQNANLIVTREA